MEFEFKEDKTSPYGFIIEPKDKSNYKKTECKIHFDTEYVLMKVWNKDTWSGYLFDKNKKYILWKERKKEIKILAQEFKLLSNGYKIKRKHEVLLYSEVEDSQGYEYIVDSLYYKNIFQISKNYFEINPIETIYEEYKKHKEYREDWDNKRKNNEEKYLNPLTSKEERIKILYEEISRLVGLFTYHGQFRGSDKLENLATYKEYESSYFSKVENKEEIYVEYLKAYNYGLKECALDDMNDDEENEFIKQKCKEVNLLKYYYNYYFKIKKSKIDFIIFLKPTNALSQWYECKFTDNENIIYNSAKQYMMAKKALLFKDNEAYKKIMNENELAIIKKLGRKVKSFDSEVWDEHKEDIVYKANYFKFVRNEELKNFLKSTGNKTIVEANPNDAIWSCGLKENDENIYNESKWLGSNLLGKILMQVRDILFEDEQRDIDDYVFIKRTINE